MIRRGAAALLIAVASCIQPLAETTVAADETASLMPVASVEIVGLYGATVPANIRCGDRADVVAIVKAADGSTLSGRTVTWASSDSSVASLSSMAPGVATIQAIAPGGATIAATSGGVRATVALAVVAP